MLFLSEIISACYYLLLSAHTGNIKCKYYQDLEEKHVVKQGRDVYDRKVGEYFDPNPLLTYSAEDVDTEESLLTG